MNAARPTGFRRAAALLMGMQWRRMKARAEAQRHVTGNPTALLVFGLLGIAVGYAFFGSFYASLARQADRIEEAARFTTEDVETGETLPSLTDAQMDTIEIRSDGTAGGALISLLLAVWWLGTALQSGDGAGDGLRRRNPMWEWYASLPAPASAAFVAEIFTPILTNPNLLAAPFLVVALSWAHTRSLPAAICAYPLGLLLLLAAVVWSKAIELCIVLRATPRNRATWFALFAMVSYVLMLGPVFLLTAPALGNRMIVWLLPFLGHLPDAGLILGADSVSLWLQAFAATLAIAVALTLPAFALLRFAVARGIEGGFGREKISSDADAFSPSPGGRRGLLDDPLRRKDLLWLRRDRSAWLQLLVFPLLFLTPMLLTWWLPGDAQPLRWYQYAGLLAGIGGYLLFASGPRALASETTAIGLALSWPRSLEEVLRMRTRTILALVGGTVLCGFVVLLWKFPENATGVVAAAAGWMLLAVALSEKSITTVRANADSDPKSTLRAFLPGLGNLTFAIGVYHAQWDIAIVAIVLNWVLASALWQDFRHRLPYLLDPLSEPAQPQPSVLSAFLAIVGLMEISTIVSVLVMGMGDPEEALYARSLGYGMASVFIFVAVMFSLARRGATPSKLLALDEGAPRVPLFACAAAGLAGAGLAGMAQLYSMLLYALPLPLLHEQLRIMDEFMRQTQHGRLDIAIMAVGFAPWIEEFLFRGLLFRSMLGDGVGRAAVVSSALFAILHFWAFWPMIFALGVASALVYHRSRALVPCIVLHGVYNALVVVMQ